MGLFDMIAFAYGLAAGIAFCWTVLLLVALASYDYGEDQKTERLYIDQGMDLGDL